MTDNTSHFKHDPMLPVEFVIWHEAIEFCDRMSKKINRVFRLPTEAEWEYCCRAGSNSEYFFGDDATLLPQHAWFDYTSMDSTHPVANKSSNPWGLYDTVGNAWE